MKKRNQIQTEIAKLRNNDFSTKRATVKALEKILYKSFKILDHGFVRVIDYMGNDSSIVQVYLQISLISMLDPLDGMEKFLNTHHEL